MANRLTKLVEINYTPARPYVPGRAAYCESVVTGRRARFVYNAESVDTDWTQDSDLQLSGGAMLTGYDYVYQTVRKCYPAAPDQAAVPAVISYRAIAGWNGSARSIEPVPLTGHTSFNVMANPVAVVAGLTGVDGARALRDVTHGFYVHGTVVEVMERGAVVATAPSAHDASKRLEISRANGAVRYQYDGWSYTSTTSSRDTAYLGAALYASADYVEDPLITQVGVGGMTLPALACVGGDGVAWAQGGMRLPKLIAYGNGLTGTVGSGGMTLPKLLLRGADYDVADGRVTLPRLAMDGEGGHPEVQILYGAMALPPLYMQGNGLAGTVGSGGVTLPRQLLRGTDKAGGEGKVTLPALRTLGLARPELDYGYVSSTLLLASRSRGYATLTGTVESTLQLSNSAVWSVLVGGEVFSTLTLSSQSFAYQLLSAVVESTLLLSSSAESWSPAVQYAVNVLTGALTTYEGFNFSALALAEDACYGVRDGGLYKLEPGTDDGQPIDALIDFGATDFGTIKAKTVDSVFLGITTDGRPVITLDCDGKTQSYQVAARGSVSRAKAARGVSGRTWSLLLEVAEVTEFELDTVEQLVQVSTHRGIR